MSTRGNPNPEACPFSPKKSTTGCFKFKYLIPGVLAKLRDSKITNNRRITQISASDELVLVPPASTQQDQTLNQENRIPSFALPTYHNRPSCLNRKKKLFAVTPTFTPANTHQEAELRELLLLYSFPPLHRQWFQSCDG
ncbi:hypothetical protein JHK82_040206 [Glycine max]|nr:hypothetical protein JHK82_040206 [Glycine max]KAG5122275.1 hypothetical protein JHK84_040615 [Glycine max]